MTTISAEEIGNNIDLLTQILIRVPTKPLVRSKCVSKQWHSLISDPQFCVSHTRHLHSQQYPTPIALLLLKDYFHSQQYSTGIALLLLNDFVSTPEYEMVPIKPDIMVPKVPSFDFLNAPRIRIRQSCNGLLLCSSRSKRQYSYYICNPTTKQFKTLSPSYSPLTVSSVCMAFDPLKSNHYKLIDVLPVGNTDNNCHIDMYSSETDSWSHSGITFTPPDSEKVWDPVFCNGAIHWYSKGKTSLYFDVDRECLNTMPMPQGVSENWDDHEVKYFGESRGHLHLVVRAHLTFEFDVWELAPDYSGWFVRYHVNLYPLRTVFPDLFWHGEEEHRNDFSVLCVIRAQKQEEATVVVSLKGTVISYNVSDGTSMKLCKLQSKPKPNLTGLDCRGYKAYQYFQTLSCV